MVLFSKFLLFRFCILGQVSLVRYLPWLSRIKWFLLFHKKVELLICNSRSRYTMTLNNDGRYLSSRWSLHFFTLQWSAVLLGQWCQWHSTQIWSRFAKQRSRHRAVSWRNLHLQKSLMCLRTHFKAWHKLKYNKCDLHDNFSISFIINSN